MTKEHKVKCKYCKSTKWLRSAVEPPVLIEIWEDKEGNTRDEDIGTCITYYKYVCGNCGRENRKLK